MTAKSKYIIAITSVTALGLGYFIYSKIKISKLNKQVMSVNQVEEDINNIDVPNTPIEATEPDVPLVSPSFTDYADTSTTTLTTTSNYNYYG